MHLSHLGAKEDILIGKEYGGIELSGGQKQRLAILRARYKQANILAFDEPTSAIDPFQEKEIYDQLIEMMRGKTSIIISHRLALTKDCDQIIVLKKGRIVEAGTHDELIEANGVYAEMWKIQAFLYS